MALMLRMDGIPARVATGFAPGAYDALARTYRVRDLDAHSWVEVFFRGIGWVTFDPTPSLAPAKSQSAPIPALRALGSTNGDGSHPGATKLREPLPSRPATSPSGPGRRAARKSGAALWAVIGSLLLALSAALALRFRRWSRRTPETSEEAVHELRRALDALGYGLPTRTTLAQLERRVQAAGGAAAVRYVRALSERRYSASLSELPSGAERAALRRALTAGRGIRARAVGLAVLPPRRHRRSAPARAPRF